jgi:hypothetical protein
VDKVLARLLLALRHAEPAMLDDIAQSMDDYLPRGRLRTLWRPRASARPDVYRLVDARAGVGARRDDRKYSVVCQDFFTQHA